MSRTIDSRTQRRAFTKGAPGRDDARARYYSRFRNGDNPVNLNTRGIKRVIRAVEGRS
jgi:hypothetical protein